MATAQRVAIGVERGDIVQYGRDERWQHGVVADIIGSTAIVHRPKTHSYVKVRVSDIVRIYGQAVVRLLAGSRADLPPGVTRPAPTNNQRSTMATPRARKTPARKTPPRKAPGRRKAPHGLTTTNITDTRPGNNLPPFIKDQAETRGYGDAADHLDLVVTQEDINKACAAQAHGDGRACVMAQAAKRLSAQHFYFYRTSAWVDWGIGPIMRYITSNAIRDNIIKPFDNHDRAHIEPGKYKLRAPAPSMRLTRQRQRATNPHGKGTRKNPMVFNTERQTNASLDMD